MTEQQLALVAALDPEFVTAVDTALLSFARPRTRKVQMLVMLASSDVELRGRDLPPQFFVQRIQSLVDRGLLILEGNIRFMRYSEVHLPEPS